MSDREEDHLGVVGRARAISGEFYPSLDDYVEGRLPRVLFVESDGDLRHIFATQLRRDGYAVLCVLGEKDALDIISAIVLGHLPPPQVTILDVHPSPAESNVEVLRAMRHARWEIPLIVMSAHFDMRIWSVADDFEVFMCLTKPVSSLKLSVAIGVALQEDEAGRDEPATVA
jgi:DNA-binding NtrC family response regulator